MKALLTFTVALGLMIGVTQAGSLPLLSDCATKISFGDKDDIKAHKDDVGGKYAGWAISEIVAAGLDAPSPSAFSKVDTGNQVVRIGSADQFIMLHWGNGGNPEPYQLIDVSACEPGEYFLSSPRRSGGGLSWVGRFNGGGVGVPDGGTTLILMGLALCGLGSAKRMLRR